MGTSRLRDALLDPRALAVPIFFYGCARAFLLSITHDEALTYLLHVRAPWRAVLAHAAPLPSNNHLLNTLAVKSLQQWLPPTELALRVPALLGLATFLLAAALLVRRTTSGIRRPLGFLLLAANPFVLDLLIVCRGYALALGLSLAALALLVAGPKPGRERNSTVVDVVAAVAAGLAVTANLAFLFAFVALAAVAACHRLADAETHPERRLVLALASVAPFAVVAMLLRAVYSPVVLGRIERVVSSWGGVRGLWTDTVRSLVEGTLYGAPWLGSAASSVTTLGMVLVAAATLVAAVWCVAPTEFTGAGVEMRRALRLAALFVFAWGALVSGAHWTIGIRYPIERAASVAIPAGTLVFVLLWETAAHAAQRRRYRLQYAVATGLVAVSLLHFAACVNLSSTYLWRYDADTRAAMDVVASVPAPALGALRLGVSWQLEPAANFYRVTRGLAGLAPVTREDPRTGFDLYLLMAYDAGLVRALGLRQCVVLPVADTVLAAAPGFPCPVSR